MEAAGRQHQRGSKSILAEEALTVFCLKIFFTITLKAVREKIQLIISMMMKQTEELFTTSLSWHSFSAGGKSTSVLWADWWRAAAASVRMFLREVSRDKIKTKLLWNIWWCHCFFAHVSRIASGWTLMKRSISLIKVHPEARKAALHTLVTTIYIRFIIQTAFGRVCVLIWRMLCGVVAACVLWSCIYEKRAGIWNMKTNRLEAENLNLQLTFISTAIY